MKGIATLLFLGVACLCRAQTLDESLLDNTSGHGNGLAWAATDPGTWNVWLEVDGGTLQQFEGSTSNNVREAALLGHPEWSNNTLTNTLSRMSNGFNSAVEWQGWYTPRHVRMGASREVGLGVQAGLQVGKTWAPAYVHCLRADGEAVVATWNQVRFADFVDQYLYFDDLHNGNLWQYQSDGTFADGLTARTVEVVVQQELAYGLGWTASLGSVVGLNGELERRAAALFGGQGLLDPNELGPTLTPVSVAASPRVASLGMTFRAGAVVAGFSWSTLRMGGGANVNEWIAAGADPIASMNQARLRLGMTF